MTLEKPVLDGLRIVDLVLEKAWRHFRSGRISRGILACITRRQYGSYDLS